MVIIWQGLGFLVAVIVFGCSLAANLISNATVGDGYYDRHKWPAAVSLIVSAGLCWLLGSYLGARSDRIAIDKETGKEFVVNRSRHGLFFYSDSLLATNFARDSSDFVRSRVLTLNLPT